MKFIKVIRESSSIYALLVSLGQDHPALAAEETFSSTFDRFDHQAADATENYQHLTHPTSGSFSTQDELIEQASRQLSLKRPLDQQTIVSNLTYDQLSHQSPAPSSTYNQLSHQSPAPSSTFNPLTHQADEVNIYEEPPTGLDDLYSHLQRKAITKLSPSNVQLKKCIGSG